MKDIQRRTRSWARAMVTPKAQLVAASSETLTLAPTPHCWGDRQANACGSQPCWPPRERTWEDMGLWGAGPAPGLLSPCHQGVQRGQEEPHTDPPTAALRTCKWPPVPWQKLLRSTPRICPNRQIWQLSAQRGFWFHDDIPNMNCSHPSQERFARQETAQWGGEYRSAAETTQAGADHATAEHLAVIKTAETTESVLMLYYRASSPLWLLNL